MEDFETQIQDILNEASGELSGSEYKSLCESIASDCDTRIKGLEVDGF